MVTVILSSRVRLALFLSFRGEVGHAWLRSYCLLVPVVKGEVGHVMVTVVKGEVGHCLHIVFLFLSSGVRLAMHGYCHIVFLFLSSRVRLAMHGYCHIVFLFLSSRVRLAMHEVGHAVILSSCSCRQG